MMIPRILYVCIATIPALAADGMVSADLYKLHAVGEVQLSPDGTRVAYTVTNSDRPGRPYSQTYVMRIATGQSKEFAGSGPRWSPDGQWIAYIGRRGGAEDSGLIVVRPDGTDARFITEVTGTNHPLPSAGERLTWSPDGKQIAYVSSTPGPEADANGDPMVITRYLYKPTASEGMTRFNDNRRTHIFVADIASKASRQLTRGEYYEHSIDWSPDGKEILFISNRGPDPDRFFNYDVFSVRVDDGPVRRITDTKNAEYRPVWSPDGKTIAYLGTKRPLTSSETTMEDTHVWLMNADGSNRRDIGAAIDNRQGAPVWSPDGKAILCTVRERGSSHLYRLPLASGKPEVAIGDRGSVGSWSIANDGTITYAYSTPSAPADLFLKPSNGSPRQLTFVNKTLFSTKRISEVEALDFKSFDGLPVQAFLTKPLNVASGVQHPMIVMIHGGPHGEQGPEFNSKAQIYANQGYATLMVNYRGSTGYGQKHADAIFKDQDGAEAKDVLAGVDAALAKYPWIDANRLGIEGGSYGGQLTDWIITQTTRFKAAIPAAGIANLVSFNYMSYYHDYLAVEFGSFPHENHLMDLLWERSALRYVDKVKTPVMFINGENDNDVPIAEAEQYFIALKDAGVETIMLRYPREGHGVRETKHVVDVADRSIAWYERHFSH
jgi:dipeptidyl aminopeptidase/acylaminoacyl peptidase